MNTYYTRKIFKPAQSSCLSTDLIIILFFNIHYQMQNLGSFRNLCQYFCSSSIKLYTNNKKNVIYFMPYTHTIYKYIWLF